jgi:UDP-N-acetylmuramoyl-tripeptide--D-alanyl-D-alanine ligase
VVDPRSWCRQAGDIHTIAKWLPADVVIITRIGDTPAHVEFYESADHLAEEKAGLINALKKDGLLVLNQDDHRIMSFADRAPGKVVTFGLSSESDVYAENIDVAVEGHKLLGLVCDVVDSGKTYTVRLPELLGKHHAYTILAAFGVATRLDIDPGDVVASLSAYTPPPGRMRIIEGLKQSNIIDDTYNASPVAVKAGLETLGEIHTDGIKIAILGDMLELGSFAVEAHKEVGVAAAAICDKLFVVGPRAQYIVEGALLGGMSEKDIVEFKDSKEAGKYTERMLKPGDIVFVKGSQGMRMEKAVEEIMAHPENRLQMLVRQEKEWEVR